MTQDEIQAVARAVHGELSHIDVMKYLDMPDDTADRVAKAAIAALDAVRGDRVAQVVEWQPIETAPKDGTFIQLVDYIAQPPVSVGCYDAEEGWLIAEADFMPTKCRPRYWAPLLGNPAIAQVAISETRPYSDINSVKQLVAYMKTIEPDEETAGCPATWADFIQILEGIAEAGEPFNG